MDIFSLVRQMLNTIVYWLRSIPVFGTDLFTITLGFLAVSFVLTAIRFLFGGDRGGSKG